MVCAAARRATTRRLRASPETMRLSASRPRTPAAHAAAMMIIIMPPRTLLRAPACVPRLVG